MEEYLLDSGWNVRMLLARIEREVRNTRPRESKALLALSTCRAADRFFARMI